MFTRLASLNFKLLSDETLLKLFKLPIVELSSSLILGTSGSSSLSVYLTSFCHC